MTNPKPVNATLMPPRARGGKMSECLRDAVRDLIPAARRAS